MSESPNIEVGKTVVEIAWSAEHISKCNVKWLRFHCHCKRCWQEFSGMYPLDRAAFDDDFCVASAEIKDSKLLMQIDKEQLEDHITVIPLDWLKTNCNCAACLANEISRRNFKFVDPKTAPLPTVEYKEILQDEGLFKCLGKLTEVGFCVIRNVPQEDQIVLKVAEMIGPIKSTLYEKFFDIRYKPNPYVSSFTTITMPFHQDLPYYEAEPGVQLLHAMAFDESVVGGESQMVDLFQVANILREESPEDFKVLSTVPGTFETKDLNRPHPAWYGHVKQHIEVDYFGEVVSIHWNPGVEGPLRVREKDADAYYKAYIHFLRIIRRSELEFLFRLQPGDLLIFNNHRMAHARKGYSAGDGKRHLQGCYVNLDDTRSKYMVLAHKLGKEVIPPKVGNRSSF